MEMHKLSRMLVMLLMAFLVLGAVGCDEGDMELIRDLAEDWAREKNIHPTNEDGSVNFTGAWNIAKRAVGGSTGDREADAAIDAAMVVKNIKEADELMEKGRQDRDAAAMDDAIAKRPDDWSYRTSRAVLSLEQGDMAAYDQESAEASERARQAGSRAEWLRNEQEIEEMEKLEGTVVPGTTYMGFRSQGQCEAIYKALSRSYEVRAGFSRDDVDVERAVEYYEAMANCSKQ